MLGCPTAPHTPPHRRQPREVTTTLRDGVRLLLSLCRFPEEVFSTPSREAVLFLFSSSFFAENVLYAAFSTTGQHRPSRVRAECNYTYTVLPPFHLHLSSAPPPTTVSHTRTLRLDDSLSLRAFFNSNFYLITTPSVSRLSPQKEHFFALRTHHLNQSHVMPLPPQLPPLSVVNFFLLRRTTKNGDGRRLQPSRRSESLSRSPSSYSTSHHRGLRDDDVNGAATSLGATRQTTTKMRRELSFPSHRRKKTLRTTTQHNTHGRLLVIRFPAATGGG